MVDPPFERHVAHTPSLRTRTMAGGHVLEKAGLPGESAARRLQIPEGPSGQYRLAQLDDYGDLRRHAMPWHPPLELRVRAQASASELPGTWGFGWWNNPFSLKLGFGGSARRLPALPNAAWFFHASPPNHLAFSGDHPAQGFLAGTFAAPRLPFLLLALGSPALPLLAWPPTARLLRRLAGVVIREDAAVLNVAVDRAHTYVLRWTETAVTFEVDGAVHFATDVVPHGPLGLVLWIDNQYMAFPPDGRLRFGTLANPEAWLDLYELTLTGLE